MKKKVIYITRQFLLGILALQILNMSVGNSFNSDDGYDYSYSYNKTYDPTESAVEWIVELNYGQQPDFSYDFHQADAGKNLVKVMHWKTDIRPEVAVAVLYPETKEAFLETPSQALVSRTSDMVSPPPELSLS